MAGGVTQNADLTERPTLMQAHINDVLPHEILSYIFTLSVPIYNIYRTGSSFVRNSDSPLLIACVCKLWKEIAWNTPQLWAFVVFNLKGSRNEAIETFEPFNARISQLHQWISRSGSTPLSISVVDYGARHKSSRASMHALFSSLSQYSHRLEHIAAHIAGPGLPEYCDLVHQARNLRSFSFKCFTSASCDLYMTYFHLSDHKALTTVSLNQIEMNWFSPDWKRVTHLRLRHFYVGECLNAVSQSTNLVHLSIRFMTAGPNEPILQQLGSPILLPRLQYLDWYSGPKTYTWVAMEAFMSSLTTPALRIVRWISYHTRFHPSAIKTFFNGCSPSLEVFIIGYGGGCNDSRINHEGYLLNLWGQSPKLTIVDLNPRIIQGERSEMPCLTDDSIQRYDNPRSGGWDLVRYLLPAMRADGDIV